jgi:uncharacterized surface protein with fasciclin (FAS1) repeats
VALCVTACGSDETPDVPAPASQAAAPADGASADGVTTAAELFGPACSEMPQGGVPGSALLMAKQPVATAAATNPLLGTLSQAIQKGGVADNLNGLPAATVFAPYDAAFTDLKQSLGPDKFNALLADSGALSNILKYHVVPKRYDRAGLVSAGTVTTLQGGTLAIKNDGDTIDITDNSGGKAAHVLCGNVPTANATVFLIDRVLTPKQG